MSKRIPLTQLGLFVLTLLMANTALAFEWQDLWSSPDQRALKKLENERFDELIEQAPNTQWKGLGEYRSGDYTSAVESFAQHREQAESEGTKQAAEQATYNYANALTKSNQYAQAIAVYDQLLDANPEHENAKHNRDIAQQLLEQEQQEQEQQNQDQGEQGEQGEEGEQGDQDQQESNGENQDSENGEESQSDDQQSEQGEQQDGEQQNNQSSDTESGDEQEANAADQQAQEEEAAEAAKAMEEERKRAEAEAELNENTDEDANAEASQAATRPLTEQEQANEQWLRQIPDDPAGLLQRKIQNRHLTDFPKVKDSANPW